ncbi:hypothetical protein SporoP37_16530 (plasmid) [Sporosarcina sp. P37]|nr:MULTISPECIES: sporulation histidine kinase inhibitor Sda [unclassified Sporosarcina]ARK26385.1 hypothetical protein SporoP37_16530 [Sporosarcina sp. P37]
MEILSDKELLEAYDKAVKFDLDREFIRLLEEEIKRRNL